MEKQRITIVSDGMGETPLTAVEDAMGPLRGSIDAGNWILHSISHTVTEVALSKRDRFQAVVIAVVSAE